jgi:hypothetical protein
MKKGSKWCDISSITIQSVLSRFLFLVSAPAFLPGVSLAPWIRSPMKARYVFPFIRAAQFSSSFHVHRSPIPRTSKGNARPVLIARDRSHAPIYSIPPHPRSPAISAQQKGPALWAGPYFACFCTLVVPARTASLPRIPALRRITECDGEPSTSSAASCFQSYDDDGASAFPAPRSLVSRRVMYPTQPKQSNAHAGALTSFESLI